jgi:anti-anti-sigma factor
MYFMIFSPSPSETSGNLVIDSAAVDFMSSVGLRSLTRAARVGKQKSVTIRMANLNNTLAEIFQITRFDRLFKFSDSVDAALAA